jgi:hypothetical protein
MNKALAGFLLQRSQVWDLLDPVQFFLQDLPFPKRNHLRRVKKLSPNFYIKLDLIQSIEEAFNVV